MKHTKHAATACLLLAVLSPLLTCSAQTIEITGIETGAITWNATSVSVAHVEWNWNLQHPEDWSRSWDTLRNITPTNEFMTTRVPMFFRISGMPDGDAILTNEKKSEIQDLVDDAIVNYEIPGISYAIKFFDEPVYANARGVKNESTSELLSPADRMRIGSASKTFASMGMLKLVSEGYVRLDQPIPEYFPAITNLLSNYETENITARMLIQHTSGIRSYTDLIDDWSIPFIFDRTRQWSDAELVGLINIAATNTTGQHLPPISPGRIWQYSNTPYVILGMIIEELTQTNMAAFVQDTFLAPLDLQETHYPLLGETLPPEPYSRGYINWANFFGVGELPGWTDVTVYDPSGVGAAGSMMSTASDLTKWMEAIITDQIGLGTGYLPEIYNWKLFMERLFAGTDWNYATAYGLGLAHETDRQNSAKYFIVGHRGQLSGYDTGMMALPDKRVSIVVMCNRSLRREDGWPSNALEAVLNDIVAVLYPDMIAASQIAPFAPAPDELIPAGDEIIPTYAPAGSQAPVWNQHMLSEY